MSAVVNINDPSYAETKAVELIMEAKGIIKSNGQISHYNEKISQALSLLALAKVQRGPSQTAKKERSGVGPSGQDS
jgi:hypothetical protein